MVNVGPEGAIYFCDWSNSIIGHLQHHLRQILDSESAAGTAHPPFTSP